ncbi:MAG: MFS transporter [Xanthomonadaceae bacterium]|nr:MFS transporter [Xanthomonadaceae bacterium]
MAAPSYSSQPAGETAPRWMLPVICSAAFLVFAQTFMVAPLIPRLAAVFHSPVGWIGLAIPAYVVPQGLSILFAGPLSDRLGRRRVILGALSAFCLVTAATATAQRVDTFIGWRVLTGIVAAGIVPIGLTLIGDVIPYRRRGRAVGWLFGSIAGGTAAGAAVGALLEPVLGWRGLFLVVAGLCATVVAGAIGTAAFPRGTRPDAAPPWSAVRRGYVNLLAQARARRTYAYVMLNAILQSGVFTWLGVYLHGRFGLDETHIGLVLLGYGVPGLLFGPVIGKLADRYGRAQIIPAGVALTGACALALMPTLPLAAVQAAIILLSLGFDLTQPLLAGIATDLKGAKGQAVALMAFSLFTGFGLGSLLFQAVLGFGFPGALGLFGSVAFLAAAVAVALFRSERPGAKAPPPLPPSAVQR